MTKPARPRGLFGQPASESADPEIIRIVKLALRLSRRHLSAYAHPRSPQRFTQPQLFACLILKAHLGVTYRRIEELLILMPAVCEAMGLQRVPRFTTLQAFAARPEIVALMDGVLASIGRAVNKANPQQAALDGTGLETTSASAHFISRAGRKRTKFVKLTLVVLCSALIPCALVADWGPSHDMKQAWAVREKLKRATTPTCLWGDSAFDCEAWHRANWNEWGVPSYAPTVVRRSDGGVNGFYRSAFVEPVSDYGNRWAVETVNSAFKRVSGSVLRSRKEHTLFVEASLKVVAYAIKR